MNQQNQPEIEYCTVYHCAGDCGQPHNQKEMQEFLTSQPQQEPVAAECNFVGTKEWGRCSIEHHNLVQSEPHNWPGYQTRLLYTSPGIKENT